MLEKSASKLYFKKHLKQFKLLAQNGAAKHGLVCIMVILLLD